MTVFALGLNHKTAPLDLRGRFALAEEQLPQALAALRQAVAQQVQAASNQVQAAILSTCNRTDLYCHVDGHALSPQVQRDSALGWLATLGGVPTQSLDKHVYAHHAQDAARHAFKVASGLDSMVLGESQILGQFKSAVRAADAAGALGPTLNQLFQRSFAVAKDVRSQTEIAQASISMPAAAVRLAEQLFEDLSATRMLFVGAGEMIELAATHFAARNPKQLVIANRSPERSAALALRLNEAQAATVPTANNTSAPFAQTCALAELPTRLHEFDIVVSCTASTLPIIGLGAVERALKARRRKPMFMVDLAVPRDIEPEVQRLGDVYLYTVDDLATLVQQGKVSRQAAVAQAQGIVDAGVEAFMQWLQARQSLPLIQRLNAQADTWRQAELARARKALARGDDADAVLEALSKALMQKALHGSYAALNETDPLQRERAVQAVERLWLKSQ